MKAVSILRVFAVLALGALIAAVRAGAADFSLSVTGAPNPVVVDQPLTYTINVTNLTGLLLSDVLVTNQLSAAATFIGATNTRIGEVTIDGDKVTFRTDSLPGGEAALMTLVIAPSAAGIITNTISVGSPITVSVTSNLTTQVIAGRSDLRVSLTGPAIAVMSNDWMTFKLSVTNAGPDAAPGVVVSNHLAGFKPPISFSPTNPTAIFTNNSLLLSLGTLASGGFTNITFLVQPTNTGVLTISATVSAPDLLDTNSVNDTASTNINVGAFLSGSLVASNVSAMIYSPQTGLMNQTVRLVNVGTNDVASARIVVSGLTNRLFSAAGTNDGKPFVVYAAPLSVNQSADLVFEYFVPTRVAIVVSNSQFHPVEVTGAGVTVPDVPAPNITNIVQLASGAFLIEFPAVLGRSYTVYYSSNVNFSNAFVVLPPLTAPGDKVQWIDDGPPKTSAHPTNSSSRYYRVLLNP